MIGIVATIKTKPGQGAAFEEVAQALAREVNANEPGCLLYVLCRAEEPDTYVFMERYKDEAAVEAHRAAPHFKEYGRKMGEFMDGRPSVQRLKDV
ncbi:MAG: antibiotic biosynthesis monooxygenase [Gammaproteobacteria bacterium]|jgi:quinol monooxygenase YgiN|nr:antibiotic biosynthesis monooxygenase [Gammaproteobacteria bacterium]